MKKFICVLALLNLVASGCGKVIKSEENGVEIFSEHISIIPTVSELVDVPTGSIEDEGENDFEEIVEIEDIKKSEGNKNDTVDNYFSYVHYYRPTVGATCDKNCSYRFISLGPFTFGNYANCYIHSGTAGPNDRAEYGDTFGSNYFVDINAKLKCTFNGRSYNNIQKVHIDGKYYTEDFGEIYKLKSLPSRKLVQGSNVFNLNKKDKLTITLSNCAKIWTHGASNDCSIDIVEFTKDGRCGLINGVHKVCSGSNCCSKHGYCGDTTDYCGTGCKSFYGKACSRINIDTSKSSGTTTDGRCGTYNGKSCHSGYCCSKYGYCGKTKDYCGTGCQGKFGKCY